MQAQVAYALISVLVVSVISLIGVLFMFFSEKRLAKVSFIFVGLAVGALFGDVFIHLLPEIFQKSDNSLGLSLIILSSIVVLFSLEKFLHWHHEHDPESAHPVGYISLVGDGLHNTLDGILIGASYLVSIPVGIATTIAVILHEIPQEIGEFGILIHAGFSKSKALMFNFLSSLMAIVGVIISIVIGSRIGDYSEWMIAFAAGSFIYIAGSDLVPELQKEGGGIKKSLAQLGMMLLGIGLMLLLIFIE
jgi:zinc and cadmium transporter